MEIERIQESVHLGALGSWLGIQTEAGTSALKEKTGIWTSDIKKLRQKSSEFAILQEALKKNPELDSTLKEHFTNLKALEPELAALVSSASELEKEAFNELLFLKNWSTPFNFIPFLLVIWSALRVFVLPGMALLMPVAMLILPFILIRFMFNIPITAGRYTALLGAIFSGQVGNLFNPSAIGTEEEAPAVKAPGGVDLFKMIKNSLLLVTVGQSFIQPYWTFKHLYSIDTIVVDKAASLHKFKDIYNSIRSVLKVHGFKMAPNPFAPHITDGRQLVAMAHLHPIYLKYAHKRLGAFEVLYSLARHRSMVPVIWADSLQSDKPVLHLHNTFDYRVDEEHRIPFSIHLENKPHALLTGPNRGGKSTTLRAITTATLLGHTYGCAQGQEVRMSPFQTLYVCLTPEDLPGKKSRFEREIEFTAATLEHHSSKGASLVLLDELYHSTNPPDAEKACRLYTERLWTKPQTLSIISTHLFQFVEQADPSVQRLCCPASIKSDGSVAYTYRLASGICTVSSVGELLEENGLVRAGRPL